MRKKFYLCVLIMILSVFFGISVCARGVMLPSPGTIATSMGDHNVSNYQNAMQNSVDGTRFAKFHAGSKTTYFTLNLGGSYNICDLIVDIADQHDSTYTFTVQYANANATNSTWDSCLVLTTSKGGVTVSPTPGGNPTSLFSGSAPAKNAQYIRIIVDTSNAADALHMYAIRVYRQYNTNDTEGRFYSTWGTGHSGDTITLEAGTGGEKGCYWGGGYDPIILQSGADAYFTASIGTRTLDDGSKLDVLNIQAKAYTATAYTITVKRKSSLEYEPCTYTLNVKVSRKETTLTMEDAEYTYDSVRKELSATTDSNGTLSQVYCLADGITKTTFQNSGACAEGDAPIYAGVYVVTASVPKTPQYTAASKTVTLTINKANRTLSLSKGAQADSPHILTYPAADTFNVTASGTTDPGTLSIGQTTSAAFETEQKTYTYTENFNSTANGTLPAGFEYLIHENSGTAVVQDGALVITGTSHNTARHVVKLPASHLLTSNFTFEADITFLQVNNTGRWVSLVHSMQDGDDPNYVQMAVRQNATANNGIEHAHHQLGSDWVVSHKASYSSALALNTTYRLKVVGATDKLCYYINNTLIMEATQIYYPAGGFGLGIAGCVAKFDNISISGTSASKTQITATTTAATDGVVSATITVPATTNYNEATATYYYQINKGTISYTATGYTGVYDGNAHGITVSVSSPNGTSVQYGTSEADISSASNLLYTGVGNHTAYFTIEKENYHTITASEMVNITPQTLTPTVLVDDKTYDGTTVGTGTIALTGIVGTDDVTANAVFTFSDKNVGTDKAVSVTNITLSGTTKSNYALSTTTGNSTADITAFSIAPVLTAEDRLYNGTNKANGTLSLPNKISGDAVSASYAACTFDSPLVGTRTATATNIALSGADSSNYTLKSTSASDDARITKGALTANIVSPFINDASSDLMKEEITATAAMGGISLPANYTIANITGAFGAISENAYRRTGIYVNALGVTEDTMTTDIVIDGIACVSAKLDITTGQNAVFGDNTTEYGEETFITTYTNGTGAWQIKDKARVIATGTPATATLHVYLKQGDYLLVATDIGMYYGRVDVSVTKDGITYATDKIDAFFPVNHRDDYRVSKLNEASNGNYNAARGDYWTNIQPFTAEETGVYTFTFTVTGSSYLLDAQYGLGAQYGKNPNNEPANAPMTTIRKITINGTEIYGIDA